MAKGVTTEGSPASDQDVNNEADGGQPLNLAPESSADNDAHSHSSRDDDAEPQGTGKAKEQNKPTPLDALRDKLLTEAAKPEAEGTGPKTEGDEPAVVDDDPSEDLETGEEDLLGDGTGEEDTSTEPDTGKDEPKDDLYKGLEPAERLALGKRVSNRIKASLEKQKAELAPVLEAGEFLEKMRKAHGLTEKDVTASLALSASFLAGNPKAVEVLERDADYLRKHLGMKPRFAGQPKLKPFVGALPAEFADMIGVLGFEEADVRMLAAFHKQMKDPARQTESEQSDTSTNDDRREIVAKPIRELPMQQRQSTEQLSVGGFPASEIAASDDAVQDFLLAQGVKKERLGAYMDKLVPLVSKHAPVNPRTGKPDHRMISPDRRLKAVTIAHQRLMIERAKQMREQRLRSGPINGGAAAIRTNGSTSTGKSATPIDRLKRQMTGRV